MTPEVRPLSFWSTVRLLLRVAHARAAGRRKRQRDLLYNRAGKTATDWSRLGFFFTVLLMVGLNGFSAYLVSMAVDVGQELQVERSGKFIVSRTFLETAKNAERDMADSGDTSVAVDQYMLPYYSSEASNHVEHFGGSEDAFEHQLRTSVRTHGSHDLIIRHEASPGLSRLATTGPIPALLGSLALFWWMVMLTFQGEGLELDIQRRRHPMWEFLFSHPVPPGAIFLSEMLSPLAANPIYWGGPLFVGILYGIVYDVGVGLLAAFLVGVPVTISLACLGKALEVAATLRLPARSRGAVIGLMSWLGYATMMLAFFGLALLPKVIYAFPRFLAALATIPWPWLRLFLGGTSSGSFSFPLGLATCWLASTLLIAASVWFSVWATNRGLAGNFASDSRPAAARPARFGKDPLYRKEFLWFVRDRSAIVQTILIPLTVAGLQVFNLRGVIGYAQGAWNYLCGAAILFGTYFLWVLGPKSLTSEGTALWISLTWPRGLESLLKAKAWLWSLISSAMVALILGYSAYLYPAHIWKIALVGIGWFFFARSMAEKTVTLVTVTSESGEPKKIPSGHRWAAQLGMLTFAIGILTQQWNLAIVGIVYSFITAAAMWQNFRARLPYLYDPWSEVLPPAPTLMHAMVAISILVEAAAVISGVALGVLGRDNLAIARAMGYAICSIAVSIGTWNFLRNRNVTLADVWTWHASETAPGAWLASNKHREFLLSLVGAATALALALSARVYTLLLLYSPAIGEQLHKSEQQFASIPNLRLSYLVMAVGFAPFAEEYLFRGLLFRALDREWGGWRAVFGSAAFFAIYHPTLAWPPVFLLGATNALIFKKTGRLTPCVILHMVYNAIVLS